MSWIFSFLLVCYALVRIVLRVRGQFRWLSIRRTLPVPPPMVAAPEHLPPALAGLFLDSRSLRAELIHARRMLIAVAVKDPDAPLGRVRDARYRRALMDSWSRLNIWLRAVNQLHDADTRALEDLHLGAAAIEQLRDSLHDKWRQVARARALELFPLEDLVAVQQTLERVEIELVAIERGLARVGEHPYRQRHDARHSAASELLATC